MPSLGRPALTLAVAALACAAPLTLQAQEFQGAIIRNGSTAKWSIISRWKFDPIRISYRDNSSGKIISQEYRTDCTFVIEPATTIVIDFLDTSAPRTFTFGFLDKNGKAPTSGGRDGILLAFPEDRGTPAFRLFPVADDQHFKRIDDMVLVIKANTWDFLEPDPPPPEDGSLRL